MGAGPAGLDGAAGAAGLVSSGIGFRAQRLRATLEAQTSGPAPSLENVNF
jgi:hypothetical protein